MRLDSGRDCSVHVSGGDPPVGPKGHHRNYRPFLAFFVAFFLVPAVLLGQGTGELRTGDRVRVSPTEGARVSGAFDGLSGGALTVLGSGDAPFSVPLGSIRSLEKAIGKNRGKGALIGGAVGLVAGAIIGAATSGDCAGDCSDPYGVGGDGLVESAAKGEGAVLGGLIFGGIGAGVGAMVFAPTRWVQVRIEPGR